MINHRNLFFILDKYNLYNNKMILFKYKGKYIVISYTYIINEIIEELSNQILQIRKEAEEYYAFLRDCKKSEIEINKIDYRKKIIFK